MKRLGFKVHATFVFGMPGETEETIRQTIAFAKSLDPTTVQFSTAVPYPGTEFHDYLSEHNLLLTHDWDNYMPMQPIYQYPHLNWEQMKQAVRQAYRSYYIRPKYVAIGARGMITQPRVFAQSLRKLVQLTFQ